MYCGISSSASVHVVVSAKFQTDEKKRALNALQKEIGEIKKV
jgi:hypothetical protein